MKADAAIHYTDVASYDLASQPGNRFFAARKRLRLAGQLFRISVPEKTMGAGQLLRISKLHRQVYNFGFALCQSVDCS